MTTQISHKKVSLGIERRSKLYFVVGNVLVACIVLSFFGFMTRNYFQNTLWKDYYYKNAFKFSDACSVQFSGTDEPTFPSTFSQPPQSIGELPHTRGFFDSWETKPGLFYHALYSCDIQTADIRIGKGVNYMHLGWIFGETIDVTVAGRKTIEIRGDDFVSFPVTHSELSQPSLNLQIRVSSSNRHRFGLASILPPVITTETKDHFSVLGIQPLYEMMNVVLPLIPTLVLGLLLGFAWLIGLKTRIVLTGMFFFVSALAAGSLPLLIPYLPFTATKIYTLGLPFVYLSHAAVLCLMLEVFGIFKTKIYHLMNGATFFTFAIAIVMLVWDGVFPYSQASAKAMDTFFLASWALFAVAAIRATLKETSKAKKRLYNASLFLIGSIGYRFGHDISRHLAWNTYVSIDFYYSFATPLFIAGIVFYYLSLIEAELKTEQQEKRLMKQGMAVSQDLLSVIKDAPQPKGCSYVDIQWDVERTSANAWQAAWLTPKGDQFIVCGEMKGTADLAGLGQVAMQAALIQCQEQNLTQPAQCLDFLNRSLVKLFHNYVRSDAAALLIRENLSTAFATAGDIALSVSGHTNLLGGTGDLLGGCKNTEFPANEIQMSAHSTITFVSAEASDTARTLCQSVQIKAVS